MLASCQHDLVAGIFIYWIVLCIFTQWYEGFIRFDYEYQIEYEYDVSDLVFLVWVTDGHTNPVFEVSLCAGKQREMGNSSGDVTDLKYKSRIRTQSRTRTLIWRSLIYYVLAGPGFIKDLNIDRNNLSFTTFC